MSETSTPVYSAKVLDAVQWSPAGWSKIILRLEELAVPLILDDLCADPREQYPVGSDVSFTLTGIAYTCNPTDEIATLRCRWEYDFTRITEDDFPAVPGMAYDMHGTVLDSQPERLVIDCGLIATLSPRHGLQFPPYPPGETVCVQGKLHINSVARPGDWGRNEILRPQAKP